MYFSTTTLGQLGDFVFSIKTIDYNNLNRASQYRWSKVDRLGRKPANQWIGEDLETITLKGIIYPHLKDTHDQLDVLRAMARNGKPYQLVYANSKKAESHGLWVIKRINETRTVFDSKGLASKVNFEITLEGYGDDNL